MKFQVPRHAKVRDRLVKLRAERLGTEEMVDRYFDDAHSSMKSSDRALRIRAIGDRSEVTYKGPKIGGEAKTRVEHNVEIGDAEKMRDILQELGYVVKGEVIKVREKWRYEDYEISLDEVEGLGSFVEIEVIVDDKEMIPPRINELKAFAIQIGIDPKKHIQESYLQLLEESSTRSGI